LKIQKRLLFEGGGVFKNAMGKRDRLFNSTARQRLKKGPVERVSGGQKMSFTDLTWGGEQNSSTFTGGGGGDISGDAGGEEKKGQRGGGGFRSPGKGTIFPQDLEGEGGVHHADKRGGKRVRRRKCRGL